MAADSSSSTGDPGWGRPRDIVLAMVAPHIAARRTAGRGALVALRSLWIGFTSALILIGLVVLILTSGDSATSSASLSPSVASAAAAVAAAALVLAAQLFRRTLPCGTAPQILALFRTRFFLRTAWTQAGALLGFVLTFQAESPYPYLTALPVALIGQWLLAPTNGHLASEDRRLIDQGCATTLTAAFRALTPANPAVGPTPPPPAPGPPTTADAPGTDDPPLGPYHQA